MEKLKFTSHIKAPREKVWQVLWNDASYREWTAAFMEGSYAETDNWKEGSKVLFLGPGRSGMVSTVVTNRPNEYMSFKHLGEVKEGVEDTTSEKVKIWSGSLENYTLTEEKDGTFLLVEMEMMGDNDMLDYFRKTWPIALEKIKQLAESK